MTCPNVSLNKTDMDGNHYIRENRSQGHINFSILHLYYKFDDCSYIELALVSELVSTRLAGHSVTPVALEATSDDRTASDSAVGRGAGASTKGSNRRTCEVAGAAGM